MRILVLGASGFLGSHVADQLTLAGHQVRVFDREPSPWLHQDQQMIVGDLLDQATLYQAIDGCDVVYNFAAIADLDEALQKPVETARINVLGNVQILEACRKFGISRYVYASTVYVTAGMWIFNGVGGTFDIWCRRRLGWKTHPGGLCFPYLWAEHGSSLGSFGHAYSGLYQDGCRWN